MSSGTTNEIVSAAAKLAAQRVIAKHRSGDEITVAMIAAAFQDILEVVFRDK